MAGTIAVDEMFTLAAPPAAPVTIKKGTRVRTASVTNSIAFQLLAVRRRPAVDAVAAALVAVPLAVRARPGVRRAANLRARGVGVSSASCTAARRPPWSHRGRDLDPARRSFANANVHFHTLVPEGVWYEQPDGTLAFHALPPPTDEDVRALTTRIVRRVARLVAARDADAAASDPPELDELAHANADAVHLPRDAPSLPPVRSSSSRPRRRTALVDGFSLHADTVVDAGDRTGLERLCRYLLRPWISADRLTLRDDGRVEYMFKRPDPTGCTLWVTDGPIWLRRLATLVPPPRAHTTRFHGVFGPAHRWRSRIVPAPPADDDTQPAATSTTPIMRRAGRLDWAALLRRAFGDDVTRCPHCDHQLRVVALITDPRVTTAILEHLGMHSDLPRLAPARAPPDTAQADLHLDS